MVCVLPKAHLWLWHFCGTTDVSHPSVCLDGCVCVSDMDKKLHLVKQSYQLWLLRGRYGEELWSWVHGQQERTHDLWHLPCWEGEMAAVLAFWLPSLQQWSLSPESKWSVIWPHPHVLRFFHIGPFPEVLTWLFSHPYTLPSFKNALSWTSW